MSRASAADGPRAKASYRSLLSNPTLLVVLSVSFAGTMGANVGSPALPGIAETLPVTDSEVGLVMTAYTLPAMVLVPMTGALADVYGRRTIIVPSLLAFALSGTAIAFVGPLAGPGGPLSFVTPFQLILLLRGVQGAGVAGFMSLTVALLGDLYTGEAGATAQGLRVGSNGISAIVLPVAAGWLSGIAWNVPFLLFGLAFVVLGVAFFYLPETTGGVDERGSVGATLANYGRSLRAEITDIDTAVLISGGFARDFVRYAVLTFVPLFAVRSLDASFAAAGAALSIRGIAYIVLSPFAGSISARLSHRGALLLALALTGGGSLLIPFAPSVLVLVGIMGIYSVGDSIFSPVIKDAVTAATTDEYRSGVVGGMQLLKYGAQTASPAVFGLVLAVAGFEALFWLAAATSGIYAAAVVAFLGDWQAA